MRPFRFLATVDENPGFAELTSLARKAEADPRAEAGSVAPTASVNRPGSS